MGKGVKSYLVLQCVLHLDSIVVPEQKQLIIKSQPFMIITIIHYGLNFFTVSIIVLTMWSWEGGLPL